MKYSNCHKKFSRGGFTLVEVLIVITIIGIIATLALGNYFSTLARSKDARRRSDLEHIRAALEIYYHDCGTYPVALGTQLVGDGTANCPSTNIYMEQVPLDPQDPTVHYEYTLGAAGATYQLCALLESTTGPICRACTNDCAANTACNYSVCNP